MPTKTAGDLILRFRRTDTFALFGAVTPQAFRARGGDMTITGRMPVMLAVVALANRATFMGGLDLEVGEAGTRFDLEHPFTLRGVLNDAEHHRVFFAVPTVHTVDLNDGDALGDEGLLDKLGVCFFGDTPNNNP